MRIILTVIALGSLAAPTASSAQEATVPTEVRSAAGTIGAEQLGRDASYLASDALRGRTTPSPGLDSAAAYVVRRLSALGLKPLGDDGTFLQRYSVREVAFDTSASSIEAGGRRLRFGEDFLPGILVDSVTVSAPLVYVGHGIRAPKKGIDPYANVDVRGKIVVVHGPLAFPKGESFETLGTVRVDWMRPWDEASRQGAVGMITLPVPAALQRWEALRAAPRLRSRELDPPVPSAYQAPRLTTMDVNPSAIAPLFEGEAASLARILDAAATGEFVPSFELAPRKRVTLNVRAAVQRLRPYNVVAMVEGSDPALRHETVTLAAHLDGAVGSRPVEGDSVYNAADDNASGSAGLLAIAEAMMRGPRPRRSIVFVWDSGEETGLWGSRYFVSRPPVPLADIVTHFNVDMIGRTKQPGTAAEGERELSGPDEVYVVGPRVISTELDSLVERANRDLTKLRLDRRYDVPTHEFFYARTDAGPYMERGVPVIGVFTGLHADYHMPGDEPHKLDARKMEQVSRLVFVTAWLLADAERRPVLDKGYPARVPRYR